MLRLLRPPPRVLLVRGLPGDTERLRDVTPGPSQVAGSAHLQRLDVFDELAQRTYGDESFKDVVGRCNGYEIVHFPFIHAVNLG